MMHEEEHMPDKDPGPSIKNKKQYEALRKKGMSKEKAARIANATDTGKKGGAAKPYEERTKDELYKQAKEYGLDVTTSMKKSEIIDALRKGR